MYMPLITFIVFALQRVVFCDDDTTHWPETTRAKGTNAVGAAWQIFGSGSLRSHGGHLPTTTTTTISSSTALPKFADKARPDRPYGVIVTEPGHQHHPGQPPPYIGSIGYDASYRLMGGIKVPGGMLVPVVPGQSAAGHGGDIYGNRDMGARGGRISSHDRYGNPIGGPHDHVYVPHEEDLVDDTLEVHDAAAAGGAQDALVNDCTLTCLSTEFLCPRSCMCVPRYTRCDGDYNCEDGEDEQECKVTNEEIIKEMRTECEETERHVMCPRTFTCISKDWLCDGDDDCGDYSDETRCGTHANCSEDQFECQNGLCIQQTWVCDGDNDCKDFSDELNCTKLPCSPQEFQCSDGNCVSQSFRCDGDSDCSDDSDEFNCQLPMPNCPEGEFKCKASVRGTSSHGGKCILQRFRCDGDNDCGDWSDEEGCPTKASSCSATEFKCGDGTCIPGQWRCDREQDCDSSEDEKNCEDSIDSGRTCAPDEYTCKDGRCIMKTWLCDGVADCRRAEDEMDCPVHCEIGQFVCPLSRNSTSVQICVNQKHVCDGRKDCLGGEDEMDCPTVKNCTSRSKCEQQCVTLADGRSDGCSCRIGFTLHPNKFNCTDIDECQFTIDPVCSQECVNTHGSFRCACTSGYILRPDLRTCKALGGAVKLIMANRADIREVSLSNNKYTSIVKGLHNVIAIDYHYKDNMLFWSDVSTDVIRKSYLNGTGIRTVVQWGLESPGGISVDWVHDLVFWTDSGTRRIEVATLDGKLRAVVAANDLDKPRAIVVHPGEAYVFWTDWGNGFSSTSGPNPKIERSYMDGSGRIIVAKDGVFWPNGLAIDYPSNRIYWADAKHHVIESCAYDGTDRKKILSNNLPHPFALTIFEDLMIWTDWHTKRISAANKITGKGFRNVHEGLHFPMDIHSYHPARQPDYRNRCVRDRRGNRGGCSHMCLPNMESRRCGCPIGLTLKDDQKTCTTIPDKLLLVARKKDIRIRQLFAKNASAEVDMVIPLDGLKSTIALDWCSESDQIYWTDVGRSAISRAHLNGSNQEHLITTNLVSPAGLALDWVTNKLYWTDPGTQRIEVATIDGKKRALLIWQNLGKPRDIVVHPIDGLMFWSDWGPTPMIERASMDGSDRMPLVLSNLQFPNGLAIDQSKNRLYFVDGGTKTLEHVNFDGTGRRTVISSGMLHPFGLDIFGAQVYWTDWETHNIDVADKQSGRNRRTVLSNTSDLMDIRIFHRERRKISNPCSISNGDCSHMCLLNTKGYSCACPIGVRSVNDRVCFDGPVKYIVLAHRIDIRLISLDIDYSVDVILPFPPISNAVALDVDLQTGSIYWSDTVEETIMKSTADGQHVELVIGESLGNADGIAIDSVGRKIYWTDGGRHTVEVSELNGSNRAVLVWQELESPRGIALDYELGLMFWTDWGSMPKIERAHMDGVKRTKIVTASLVWPNGLALDTNEQRIYWVDAQMKHIVSCDYEGNARRTMASGLSYPYGIAVTTNLVYWTDWNSTALHVLDKGNPSAHRVVKGGLQGLMDVKVVNKENVLMQNLCTTNNGQCSHLCLRNPRGFSCKCPTGIKMVKGSTTDCDAAPQEYLLIALRSGIGRISLDTTDLFDVVLPIDEVHGSVVLDYHYNKSLIFYADVHLDVIKMVDMHNMSHPKTIIATGLNTPNGIAVDWLANNLYWSDTAAKVIEVSRLDGSSRKIIVKDDLNDPRSLILYPKRGYIFWTDWGKPARIERSHMDGSGRKVIVDTNNGFPTGLAIDFDSRKIYWTDALDDRIDMCDFDGKKRTTIVQHATHPFGIALAGSYIYWTDWYNKSVFRAPKTGSTGGAEIRHGLKGALDIRSVSQRRQPTDLHPCSHENGGCTHLCLFKVQSYVCGCPDTPDGRTCKIEPEFVVPVRVDEQSEYSDTDDGNHVDTANDELEPSTSKEARMVIIATAILCGLLVLVVTAILVLVFNSKRKRSKRSPPGSMRSVLTFSNPNYNGADGGNGGAGPSEPKVRLWKRLKYDKAQDRVYDDKCIGSEAAATLTLIAPTPSPMPSPSANLPLSTIG